MTTFVPSPFRTVFYGWWIVLVGGGLNMLFGALLMQSYGAYVVALRDDFGWSKAMLAAGFSVVQLESGFLGPVQGWLVDRFGPRAILRVGLVTFAIGFILFSQIQNPVMFFLSFLVIAIGSGLGGGFAVTIAIVHWFQRRRATAIGLVTTGFAIGGLLVPLVAWSIESLGWRETALISGVILLVAGLPMAQVVRHRPAAYGMRPDGAPLEPKPGTDGVGHHQAGSSTDFTAREAMRTPQFWYLSLGHGVSLLVVGAVIVHLVAHVDESLGYSLQEASFVIALLTVMQTVGTIGGGLLGDRFSKRLLVTGCMLMHAVALLLLTYATGLWMVVAFAIIHGLAWGIRGPLMQAMRADYFGPSSFGTIMGFSSVVMMFFMATGPVVAGAMADRTGNYEAGFTLLALIAALGSIFCMLSTQPKPPARLRKPKTTVAQESAIGS